MAQDLAPCAEATCIIMPIRVIRHLEHTGIGEASQGKAKGVQVLRDSYTVSCGMPNNTLVISLRLYVQIILEGRVSTHHIAWLTKPIYIFIYRLYLDSDF